MATRLYFHTTTDATGGLPTAEQSSSTAAQNMEANQATNRVMNTTIGTSQATLTNDGNTDAGPGIWYIARWVSPALYQSSIAANTWTYSFAAKEDSTSLNFPVSGASQAIKVNCYVWRPGGTKVGTILDGNTAATITEGAANVERGSTTTFTGASVSGMQNGDRVVFEAWATGVISISVFVYYYYDGATVTTTDGTVSNHASFIETPENLVLTPPPTSINMTDTASKTYSNKFITKV